MGKPPGIKVTLWKGLETQPLFSEPVLPYHTDPLQMLKSIFKWADENGWMYSPKAKENWEMMYMMRQVE